MTEKGELIVEPGRALPAPLGLEDLEDMVRAVADQRAKVSALADGTRARREEIAQELVALLDPQIVASDELRVVEEELRRQALLWFASTGEKRPVGGVLIVMERHLEYDEEMALAWAVEHGLAIQLDAAVFRRMALAGGAPGVATVTETPKVRLARDMAAEAAGLPPRPALAALEARYPVKES